MQTLKLCRGTVYKLMIRNYTDDCYYYSSIISQQEHVGHCLLRFSVEDNEVSLDVVQTLLQVTVLQDRHNISN